MITPTSRGPWPALAMGWIVLLLQGCPDHPPKDGIDAAFAEVDEGVRGQGPGLRLELRTRGRYPLGGVAWAELHLIHVEDATVPEGSRLRTRSLIAVVDGKELPERPWPMEWPEGRSGPVRLELGTVAGGALEAEGRHTLALRFRADLLPPPGKKLDSDAPLWSGEIASGEVAFERGSPKPGEEVQAVPSPAPDPSRSMEITLHLGGRVVQVWPSSPTVAEVLLATMPSQASVWVAAREPCPVDLAFDVMAIPGPDSPEPIRVGGLAVAAKDLGPTSISAGELDLSRIQPSLDGLLIRLTLVPSMQEAIRHPGITRFWDARLSLTPVHLGMPSKEPERDFQLP